MKLEVGVFIRTPLGIDKIIYLRIQDEYGCNYDTQLEHNLFLNNERDYISIDGECFEKEEIKTSHNIIDLIEPSDLMYIDISPDDCGGIVVPRVAETLNELEKWKERISNGSCILKGIVTREQFESMSYRVEE